MNRNFRKLYIKNPNNLYIPNESKLSDNLIYETNDERFGGFLIPFLTGAIVSAPFWYIGANNNIQKQMYYQNQPYPAYYPYQANPNQIPSYYPYPPYR